MIKLFHLLGEIRKKITWTLFLRTEVIPNEGIHSKIRKSGIERNHTETHTTGCLNEPYSLSIIIISACSKSQSTLATIINGLKELCGMKC